MGLFGGDTVVGLDLGSSSIKAVKIRRAGSGWEVAGAAAVPTPGGAVAEGAVVDPQALVPALKELLARPSVRGAEVVAAVNHSPAVTVRRAALPVTQPAALRKQIQTQPEQLGLPGGKESIVDFQILRTPDGEGEMDTVLVSAPRVPVESRVQAIEAAGLDTLAVDIEPLALVRAVVECVPRPAAAGAVAILDLGASHTDVTVVRGQDYVFTRTIPYGGDGLTEVIRQALECEREEAETLKTCVDMRWALDTSGSDEPPARKATVAVKPVLDNLLKEVRNSILYYTAQLAENDFEGYVNTILLTGGSARLRGLPEYLQAAFGLHVACPDFSQGFAYPVRAPESDVAPGDWPVYAMALGLAVKEPLDRQRAERERVARRGEPRPRRLLARAVSAGQGARQGQGV